MAESTKHNGRSSCTTVEVPTIIRATETGAVSAWSSPSASSARVQVNPSIRRARRNRDLLTATQSILLDALRQHHRDLLSTADLIRNRAEDQTPRLIDDFAYGAYHLVEQGLADRDLIVMHGGSTVGSLLWSCSTAIQTSSKLP